MPKYVYPAIFSREENDLYSIDFPDVPNCFTSGKGLIDGIIMAEDVLALTLSCREEDGEPIPPATPMEQLKVPDNSFATLILCDTTDYPMTEAAEDKQDQATA